jgi:hypothetical protein
MERGKGKRGGGGGGEKEKEKGKGKGSEEERREPERKGERGGEKEKGKSKERGERRGEEKPTSAILNSSMVTIFGVYLFNLSAIPFIMVTKREESRAILPYASNFLEAYFWKMRKKYTGCIFLEDARDEKKRCLWESKKKNPGYFFLLTSENGSTMICVFMIAE